MYLLGANNFQLKESFFENAVKIGFDKNKSDVKRKEFADSMKKIVGVNFIENICQYKESNSWYCSFKKDFDASSLYGKQIEINGQHIQIEPAISKSIFKCFKVNWLPVSFNKINDIASHLCAKIGQVKKTKLLLDEDGIGMGIYNITIEYPSNKIQDINFPALTGRKKFYGETAFITCYGDKIRCIYCEEFGHKKVECTKYKLICSTCNKRGHNICTIAKKIEEPIEDINIDIHEESENAPIEKVINKENVQCNLNETEDKNRNKNVSEQKATTSVNTTIMRRNLKTRNNETKAPNTNEISTPIGNKKREQPDIDSPDNLESKEIKFQLDTSGDETINSSLQ